MQMGCIMRPYFRGNALYARAESEGTTSRFMRGRSPHVMFEGTTKNAHTQANGTKKIAALLLLEKTPERQDLRGTGPL